MWKQKFNLIFTGCPRLGHEELRGILWHRFFSLNSIRKYKTGLRSGEHSKNMFVLEGKGISFWMKMISSKGFIALRVFSSQKMSYRSKEFLEGIFLHLVKVQKPDWTNQCYLAQKKVVLFNYIFY